MPDFNAATAAEPLKYDFAPYREAKGTVPEPTDDQVAAFYGDLGQQLRKSLGEERLEGVDIDDPMQLAKVLANLTSEDYGKMYDQMLDLHAAVCSGQPSREDIEALPFRLRRAWYGMVQGWLRPESSRPATDD